MKKLQETLKNIICWSYERTTWQYDLLVVLIIATVIFVPSRFFGDRDRPLRTPNEEVRRWSIESNHINKFAVKNGAAEKLKNDPRFCKGIEYETKKPIEPTFYRFKDYLFITGFATAKLGLPDTKVLSIVCKILLAESLSLFMRAINTAAKA